MRELITTEEVVLDVSTGCTPNLVVVVVVVAPDELDEVVETTLVV